MKRIASLAALLMVAAAPAFADDEVTVGDLAKNPDGFVGKKVVVSDCLLLSANTIVGAQCTTRPMDPSTLVYVDADSWTPEAGKTIIEQCPTDDIMKLCLLKVSGEVAKDGRGQALIKGAVVEILDKVGAM